MKRMINYCVVGGCETVLSTMEWDQENPEFTLYETIGDRCEDCIKEQEGPKPQIKFSPPRFGVEAVAKEDDFQTLMAKRKIENRKKSGKGAPRGGR